MLAKLVVFVSLLHGLDGRVVDSLQLLQGGFGRGEEKRTKWIMILGHDMEVERDGKDRRDTRDGRKERREKGEIGEVPQTDSINWVYAMGSVTVGTPSR